MPSSFPNARSGESVYWLQLSQAGPVRLIWKSMPMIAHDRLAKKFRSMSHDRLIWKSMPMIAHDAHDRP
jgi:hypothetical protein